MTTPWYEDYTDFNNEAAELLEEQASLEVRDA